MFFSLSPELMITQHTSQFKLCTKDYRDFPGGSDGKASACNVGDLDSIPGLGRSPGAGNGNPRQYSCLGNPMDRGAWWATAYRVANSWTQLKQFIMLQQ